ncbi:MAG TPA: YafY family protein [Kineosporiaceae bacterium]|nr:YafY family protein [Kineosporiaceae bacterium]
MPSPSLRMMRLLSLLQTHRYWPGAELADRLEVSLRTLRRDVDRLRELGYPVEAQRGVDGGYQLAAGASLPPLVLDDDEAVALALGLQSAAQAPVAGIAEASLGALAKVAQVMPPRLRRRVEALRAVTVTSPFGARGPDLDAGVLTTVAQACRDAVRLGFAYGAASGERTEREVEPLRLVPLGRRWYLVAYDLGRHDWRSFRLDRLERPVPTGVRFRPRELPAPDAATFVREGLRNLPVTFTIEVVVEAPADGVRRTIGTWATVEPLDGDRCRVLMTGDDLAWPTLGLVMLEAEFTVLRPPEMIEYLGALAGRFSRAAVTPTDSQATYSESTGGLQAAGEE